MENTSMHLLRATTLVVLGVAAVVPTSGSSLATPLSTAQLTGLMIEEEGGDVSSLGLLFGPGGSIGFSSTVDTAGMSFSFASTPGATYLGQTLSLNGAGGYNPATNILSVSSTGKLGTTAFSTSGSDSLTFSGGTAIATENADLFVAAVKAFDRHRDFDLFSDGTSTDTGFYTDKNGNKIPNSDFTSTDTWSLTNGNWNYNQSTALGFGVISGGNSPPAGGTGSFTAAVVPEPSTLALLGFGVLAFGAIRRRAK